MSYKSSNFRSKRLLDYFRHAPICFSCGKINDGTVVAAHANWAEFGKSGGLKAQDFAVAGMCHKCHSEVDSGSKLSYDERKEKWVSAWIKTLDWLFRCEILMISKGKR